ncbi:hypothetical protein QAD02_019226 [Eretmocerus hayati]|uniref:Uncharacterized protein n=1 Tax=Eretmocerus hayati TaxID=131215 RepID=A0ACC2PLG9_9HYME|nr:hypothetical protein QAD02_019226 [Eretmocerus hayati]
MTLLKAFFRRINKDFWQKELMPLKLIFFVQTSTLYILYPYLTLHMRELGINVEETAIMSAITPFVAIIMPPIAGLLADRIGNFKILLSLFSALGGAAALLLLLVPIGRLQVTFPDDVILGVTCPISDGTYPVDHLVYSMNQEHPCDSLGAAQLDISLRSCGYACPIVTQNETQLKAAMMSRNYKLNIYDPRSTKNETYGFTISDSDLPEMMEVPQDLREFRKLKNMEYYKIAIRQISKNQLFFPTHRPPLFRFDCGSTGVSGNSTSCEFISDSSQIESPESNFVAGITAIKPSKVDDLEKQQRYLVHKLYLPNANQGSTNGKFLDAQCKPTEEEASVSVDLSLPDADEPYDVIQAHDCRRTCILTAPRKQICTNFKTQIEFNVSLTFWSYLAIRVFISMIGGTAFAMFEGAVIAILREQKADYGLQRIYGSIGGMISSPLSGMLIVYASGDKGYADFRPAFYLYAMLKIFSGALMLMINLEFKVPAANVVGDVISVLKNVEVMALLTVCFILGTAWGYLESFLFWFLEDLGGSTFLMGITITVGGIAGLPLLVMSGPIISKLGHANVLFIGFIFYSIRLLGYSIITNPWHSLIFEALESVTSSLSFTAAVTYAAKLSTTTTDSSIQGLLGGLYYGVGKGSGSLIGGFLMKFFGTRPTYRIFAVMTLVIGLLYFFFNLLYLSKRPQVEGNDIVKKKPKVKEQPSQVNGSVSNIEENCEKKDKMASEVRNEPYIVDDIEAINNAKNLDIVESLDEDSNKDRIEDVEMNHTEGVRQRHQMPQGGNDNPAFEAEDACEVTNEKKSQNEK